MSLDYFGATSQPILAAIKPATGEESVRALEYQMFGCETGAESADTNIINSAHEIKRDCDFKL